MDYKSLRDYAQEHGITLRAAQRHIKNHENDLSGHIVRYGPPRGTYIDEYAQEYIAGLLVGHPVEVMDNSLSDEIERLRSELEDAQRRIISLMEERNQLTERALQAEAAQALAEATQEKQAERIQAAEERALQAEEMTQKLKGRNLWQRLTRWGE